MSYFQKWQKPSELAKLAEYTIKLVLCVFVLRQKNQVCYIDFRHVEFDSIKVPTSSFKNKKNHQIWQFKNINCSLETIKIKQPKKQRYHSYLIRKCKLKCMCNHLNLHYTASIYVKSSRYRIIDQNEHTLVLTCLSYKFGHLKLTYLNCCTYIILVANYQTSMTEQLKITTKYSQTSYETDFEDTHPLYEPQKIIKSKNIKKKSTKKSHTKVSEIYPIKILRFRFKHLKKTLRIPCYKEQQLNLPIRFTKKLNAMEADNDQDTDQEVQQHQIERCCQWLKEAILLQSSEPKQEM